MKFLKFQAPPEQSFLSSFLSFFLSFFFFEKKKILLNPGQSPPVLEEGRAYWKIGDWNHLLRQDLWVTIFKMAAQGNRKSSKGKGLDQEQIVMQFNQMRQEQRNIMGKLGELDQELNEHRSVNCRDFACSYS